MFEKTQNDGQLISKRKRARETYENLLKAALDIIHEKGIESLNSNAIVAAIGSTPPTFYRYFSDKHEVLEVLGNRLMDLRTELLVEALRKPYDDYESSYQNIYLLLSKTLQLTRNTRGSHALLLSLRALPDLRSIRIDSQEKHIQITTDAILTKHPYLKRDNVSAQVRLAMKIGYGAIEVLVETDYRNTDLILDNTTKAMLTVYEAFID